MDQFSGGRARHTFNPPLDTTALVLVGVGVGLGVGVGDLVSFTGSGVVSEGAGSARATGRDSGWDIATAATAPPAASSTT
ncbi:hypothetical protein, partial [Streptosporangium amethystogenes]|uniref:hypothetical protein n=1 Tax=Streptosporangium amethystogenes TaxID=2002 RepID=UPI0031D52714